MTSIPNKIPEIIPIIKDSSSEMQPEEKILQGKSSQGFAVTYAKNASAIDSVTKVASKPILQQISAFFKSMQQLGSRLSSKIVPISESDSSAEESVAVSRNIRPQKKTVETLESALLKLEENKSSVDPATLCTLAEVKAQACLKMKDFIQATKARLSVVPHLIAQSPFSNLKTQIESSKHPQLPLKIPNLDTSVIKSHVVSVQSRKVTTEDDKDILHLETKLTKHARENLEVTLLQLEADPAGFTKCLPLNFCEKVTITMEEGAYLSQQKGKNFKENEKASFSSGMQKTVEFKGIGKVSIGADEGIYCSARRLVIELDASVPTEQAAETLTIMLAALGLGAIATSSRTEDHERIKVLQLFRAFYLVDAYTFENDGASYSMSVNDLKQNIRKAVPDMKDIFISHLDPQGGGMYKQEVFPGQQVWCVKGMAQRVRDQDGIGLFAGVGGKDVKVAAQMVAAMLKEETGQLSSQARFEKGEFYTGASSKFDLEVGGGNSVFTRLFTKGMIQRGVETGEFVYSGKLQILYDIQLVERCDCYGYGSDKFGRKDDDSYKHRESLDDLVENPQFTDDNEICFPGRIPPQYIKGVQVSDENAKKELLQVWADEGLIDKDGNLKIYGRPVEEFVIVGKSMQAISWG